jgi:hypothetical protein
MQAMTASFLGLPRERDADDGVVVDGDEGADVSRAKLTRGLNNP